MLKLDDPLEDLMQSVLSIDEENEDEKIYRERLSKPPIVRINSQQALQNPLKLPMHNLRREVILISENITENICSDVTF